MLPANAGPTEAETMPLTCRAQPNIQPSTAWHKSKVDSMEPRTLCSSQKSWQRSVRSCSQAEVPNEEQV